MSEQTRSYFVPCMMIAAVALLGGVAHSAVIFSISQSTTTAGSTTHDIGSLGSADWAVWTGAGAPAAQKASSSLIGNLVEVNSPGSLTASVSSFSWASGGESPDTSSTGFAASAISTENPANGAGYSIDVTLSAASGTITFWGITRGSANNAGQISALTIVDSGSSQVGSASYRSTAKSTWWETTYTMDWSNATPGETVTLRYLEDPTSDAGDGRIGVSGIAVDAIPEPSTAILVGMFGSMLLLRRKRTS